MHPFHGDSLSKLLLVVAGQTCSSTSSDPFSIQLKHFILAYSEFSLKRCSKSTHCVDRLTHSFGIEKRLFFFTTRADVLFNLSRRSGWIMIEPLLNPSKQVRRSSQLDVQQRRLLFRVSFGIPLSWRFGSIIAVCSPASSGSSPFARTRGINHVYVLPCHCRMFCLLNS